MRDFVDALGDAVSALPPAARCDYDPPLSAVVQDCRALLGADHECSSGEVGAWHACLLAPLSSECRILLCAT